MTYFLVSLIFFCCCCSACALGIQPAHVGACFLSSINSQFIGHFTRWLKTFTPVITSPSALQFWLTGAAAEQELTESLARRVQYYIFFVCIAAVYFVFKCKDLCKGSLALFSALYNYSSWESLITIIFWMMPDVEWMKDFLLIDESSAFCVSRFYISSYTKSGLFFFCF